MRGSHAMIGCVVIALLVACTTSSDLAEPTAGEWHTWVLPDATAIDVPPPPAEGSPEHEAELDAVRAAVAAADEDAARYWTAVPATEPWSRLNLELVSELAKNPPLASRGYALVSVAVNDAVVAAFHHKYRFDREPPAVADPIVAPGPDPSYPSEHAAIAGAASRVLAHLFPERPDVAFDLLAEQAAEAVLAAGIAHPSDVEAGLALGRDVADAVIEWAEADGSSVRWDGRRPDGEWVWQAPPDAPSDQTQPTEPLAGTWRTWVIDVDELRPGPPPEVGSDIFSEELDELLALTAELSDEQRESAVFWAGGEGTPLPPGIWNQLALDAIAEDQRSTPWVARTMALLNVALADAGVAAWDAKYAYWSPRPENVIRDLGIDTSWSPFVPTPIFPSYVSGHSTYSAAAAEALAASMPERADMWFDLAAEAGLSRLYGGIHYQADNVEGLRLGSAVGREVVDAAGLLPASGGFS